LSYELEEGGNRPLFGTVVLDEAFSKRSHAVASRIINALTDHTRSAILVHREGQQATSISA
jgi:uncharacterized protein YPO0396